MLNKFTSLVNNFISAPSFMGFLIALMYILPWVLILYWLIASTIMVLRPSRYSFFKINAIPNVFVTIGLLGTFLGITIGLLSFDTSPEKIKESIVVLLNGLKLAFFTSITGIILSLFFSRIIRKHLADRKIKEPDSIENDTLKVISSTLSEMNTNIKNGNKNNDRIIYLMHEQTKLTKSVVDSINEFSLNLSHSNAQAIVEALQGVINDFNSTFVNFINQLVDKNFEKLTESIDQLIRWQIQYKGDIESIKKSYESLVSNHEHFVRTTNNWVSNLDEIAGKSSELAQIVTDFKAAFDDNSNFSKIIELVQNSVVNINNSTHQMLSISDGMVQTKDAFLETKNEISNWLNREEGVHDSIISLSFALKELRQFDISSIEKLDESFYNRISNSMKHLDQLMLKYIEYLQNKN